MFDGLYAVSDDECRLTIYVSTAPDDAAVIDTVRTLVKRVETSLQVTVSRFDADLVSMSDIATRLGRSREAIRLYVEGKRGPGGFPHPVGTPGGVRVWDWASVNAWARSRLGLGDSEQGLHPRVWACLEAWVRARPLPVGVFPATIAG